MADFAGIHAGERPPLAATSLHHKHRTPTALIMNPQAPLQSDHLRHSAPRLRARYDNAGLALVGPWARA